jgi:hypothetical protein
MFFNSIFHDNEIQLKLKCAKMGKSKQTEKMKKVQYPIVIILASLILINAFVTYSSCNYRLYALPANKTTAAGGTTTNTTGTAGTTTTKFNDTAALFLMINFERMRTQLMLVEQSLPVDKDLAFLHAYVVHSIALLHNSLTPSYFICRLHLHSNKHVIQ